MKFLGSLLLALAAVVLVASAQEATKEKRGVAGLAYPGYAGLGYTGLGYSGLGYSGLGYTGLGYSGLGYSGLGYRSVAYPSYAGAYGYGLGAHTAYLG